MADQGRLREVSWQELFPWLKIVSALRLAVSPSLLLLGALGALATAAGWSAIARLYSGSDNALVQNIVSHIDVWPWENAPAPRDLTVDTAAGVSASPFMNVWRDVSMPFREMFNWRFTLLPFTLLFLLALWALIVWSLFGSAITRIAAVALARGDRLGFRAGLAHGIRRWPLYAGGPAIPLIGAFGIGFFLMIGGALAHPNLGGFGDFMLVVGGILWPLALLAGFVMALLLVGLAVGWPLMWATISVEVTDPFDALSRSYSYAFHRPIRYLFYVIVAALLGWLGWFVVMLFYDLSVSLSYWGLSWGATTDRTAAIDGSARLWASSDQTSTGAFRIGTSIIGFWQACLRMLVIGFIYSYFWSAATAIYFVLRKDEDATEMSEVTYEEQEESRGLPPLATDAMGVPAVSDIPPVSASPSAVPSDPPPASPGA